MNNFIGSFLFLINIDSEMVLKWFGLEEKLISSNINFESSTELSFDTFRLLIDGLWDKFQGGLSLSEIENILFFIVFARFIILAIRYNIKTSFYIICIGIFAGYLWYLHLVDMVSHYRFLLMNIPFLNKLTADLVEIEGLSERSVFMDIQNGENFHWYNFGKMFYYGFKKAISYSEPETGFVYYIDPISMIVSKLPEPFKLQILPIYYKAYNRYIPQTAYILQQYWSEISGIVAYALITRIGKRYCPYLIRWHWTVLVMFGLFEPIFIYSSQRMAYFQTFVLIPQLESSTFEPDPSLILQINFLTLLITGVISINLGYLLFGLFHAIWGQYFYTPLLVENAELHIGPRLKTSIYSGGQTAWQDSKEKDKNIDRNIPKFWYGWFGRGTNHKNSSWLLKIFNYLLKPLTFVWSKIKR